ncbi:MAG: hypothetical protein AB7H86_18560 [Blastocatellales bacterium]
MAPLAGAFSLAEGSQQGGRRRPGSGTGLTISGEDGSILTAIPASVDDLPYSYDVTESFWGFGKKLSFIGSLLQPEKIIPKGYVQPSCHDFVDSLTDIVRRGFISKRNFPIKGGISGASLIQEQIGFTMIQRAIKNVDPDGRQYFKGPPYPKGFKAALIGVSDSHMQGGDVYHHIEFAAGAQFLGILGEEIIYEGFRLVDLSQWLLGRNESIFELHDDTAGRLVGKAMLNAFADGDFDILKRALTGTLCAKMKR